MKTKLQKVINNTPIRWKTIAAVAIPTLFFIFSLVLFAILETQSTKAMAQVKKTLEGETLLQDIQKLVLDMETGSRGYRLTHDPTFLQPYNESVQLIPERVTRLEKEVAENEEHVNLINQLKTLMDSKLTRQALVNELDIGASREEIATRMLASKDTMDKIRQVIDTLLLSKRQILDEKALQLADLQKTINNILAFMFVVGTIISLSVAFLISQSIAVRLHILENNALKIINDEPLTETPQGKDEIGSLSQSLARMNTILIARETAVREAQEEQDRLNQQLQRQVVEITDINKELEAFSYSVSHDLRAPLRHVAGFSELMMKNSANLDERNQRYLTIIINSIRQMGTLIDDLLAFSRMGRAALKSDPIDLNTVVKEVLYELLSETDAKLIEWNIEKLPVVTGDRSMIRLVMQNLIGNAVKYSSPKPHPKIEILDITQSEDSDYVIKIKDNGAGFDMKYVDKLFGVFQRLHRSEEFEGTGIGLATVRRIIQRHGGRVSAVGTPGEGAEFTFTLPQLRRND